MVGGLGNQMFCYAFAKVMEQKGYELILDATGYDSSGGGGKNIRLLEIEHFNLSIPLCKDFYKIQSYLIKNDPLATMRYYLKRMRLVLKGRFSRYPNLYQCYKHTYYENLGTEKDYVLEAFLKDSFHIHALPWGYFQNLHYLKGVDSLALDFKLISPLRDSNQIIKQKILHTTSSVFLHIRMGDYLEGGTFSRLGVGYYQKALEVMKTKIDNPYIFVFSNDINWCEKYLTQYVDFSGCGVEFVKGNTEGNAAEEMELMRSCQNAIIANSTFSWWAAYLMENPNKVVIMPKYFFNDSRRIPRYDMLALKDWVIIDNVWGAVE